MKKTPKAYLAVSLLIVTVFCITALLSCNPPIDNEPIEEPVTVTIPEPVPTTTPPPAPPPVEPEPEPEPEPEMLDNEISLLVFDKLSDTEKALTENDISTLSSMSLENGRTHIESPTDGIISEQVFDIRRTDELNVMVLVGYVVSENEIETLRLYNVEMKQSKKDNPQDDGQWTVQNVFPKAVVEKKMYVLGRDDDGVEVQYIGNKKSKRKFLNWYNWIDRPNNANGGTNSCNTSIAMKQRFVNG